MLRLRSCILLLAVACRTAPSTRPGELVDDSGVTTSLAAPPRRVVSLIPATTELVFALGAGDRLVGRTTWCDYPAAAAQVPDLGNGIDPNIEAVVAAKPDLVLLYKSGANRGAAERLRALGIPTLELATDRIADIDRLIGLLGRALGVPQAAESLAVVTDRDLAAASRPPDSGSAPPSVFILVWDRPAMTLGRGSFLTEILQRAGARNLFDDLATSSAQVSIEAVAARDPDYILVTSAEDPAIASRPEWRVVRAVRERRFLRVRGSEFNRPSPRVGLAVRELRAALAALPR
ncbi:MAG TPA: helical backbone metal receptor [Gemmatimonadales bacterium]|nr:helical backbone metal receptor [Gemmatimonadales bacterium]